VNSVAMPMHIIT